MTTNSEGKSGAQPVRAARSQRSRTLLVADCRRASGEVYPIRVRDLSASGLLGSCTKVADFEPGERLQVTFPHLAPIDARVVRFAKGELGITFRHPVDLEQIARARAAAAKTAPSPRAQWVADWISRAGQERDAEGSEKG